MRVSLKGLRNLSKAVYNVATLVVGGGIVTPLISAVQGSDGNTSTGFVPSVFIYSIAIVLYAVGYQIDCYTDSKEEQSSRNSRKKKHKIRIPRNTTVSVEVED